MPISPKQRAEDTSEQKEEPHKQTIVCIACNDTGVNSKGGTCIPCEKTKGLKWLNH